MTKKVVFKNRKGKRLVGIWDSPAGKGPFPAVLICHGFKGNKDSVWLKAIAIELGKQGIASFRIDLGNNPPPNESYGKFFDFTFSQALADLRSAAAKLRSFPAVDSKRVGIVGHSLGGVLAYCLAAEQNFSALVSLASVVDDQHYDARLAEFVASQGKAALTRGWVWVPRSNGAPVKLNVQFYKDIKKYPCLPKIRKVTAPTLILHGTADQSVPVADARLAYKNLSGVKKLVLCKGFPHSWRTPRQYRVVAKVAGNWFAKYL